MTTRRNHGSWIQGRRNTALRLNELRLKRNSRNVYEDVELTPKHRERIEREIEVLKQRGAVS